MLVSMIVIMKTKRFIYTAHIRSQNGTHLSFSFCDQNTCFVVKQGELNYIID